MRSSEASTGRIFVCRLDYDSDLLNSIKEFVESVGVKAGFFFVIGAVKNGEFSIYDQKNKKYLRISIDKALEITSCIGNVSQLNGETLIHAHVNFADENGRVYGGHLEPGVKVFSAELILTELKDIKLERKYDEKTGLNLWSL